MAEIHSETSLALPGAGRVARLLGRALRFRCPHCGEGHLLAGWFRVRPRCPRCGLRTERGERDYFLGSMLFNLIFAETLFAAGVLAILLLTWPDVPWDVLEIAAPLAMIAAPIVLYPWSKALWLAFDVMFRPVTEAELEWHRSAPEGGPAGRAGPPKDAPRDERANRSRVGRPRPN